MERKLSSKLREHLRKKPFTILIGARQVGKTTLLKQLFQELKTSGLEASYLTFEDPAILEEINLHPENIFKFLRKPTEGERVFVFIDEIQYAAQPTNFIKYLYDLYADTVKLVATGSSAFYIDQKFTDSLAGRKQIFELYTLDFEEFLQFKGLNDLQNEYSLFQTQPAYQSRFLPELKVLLEEYMLYGAYPAVVLADKAEDKIELLKELRNSFIKKDLQESSVEHEDKFYKLFALLSEQIGSLVNQNEIGRTLRLTDITTARYIGILCKCFHIQLVRPFHKNIRKELTKMPKIFFHDLGLRNCLLNQFDPVSNRIDKGAILENLNFIFLRNTYGNDPLKFWRTADDHEVDFVVELTSSKGIAIEVKWDESTFKKSKYKKFTENYPEYPLQLACMEYSELANFVLKKYEL